jgi:hypothetical protein
MDRFLDAACGGKKWELIPKIRRNGDAKSLPKG